MKPLKPGIFTRVEAALLLASPLPFQAWADTTPAADAQRPNILWLTGEDANINWIGCYGNTQASTPNIDKLAQEGFRYVNAFATAPVCACSRSTWITGIHALSTGTDNMRSRYDIPHDLIQYYPDYLRQAGYFCSNHQKTDYNIGGRLDSDCWDSARDYGWRYRSPGQPFLCVINFFESHESRAQGSVENTRHDPTKVVLEKYHPNVPEIRKNYALYEDAVQNMDEAVGIALAKLKQDGLESNTIVIFCTDNGGVMPRSKHYTYDQGLHLPLIIRIPEKYKYLWPAAAPGMTVDRLVSYVDMPKTWLSLAHSRIPDIMQGRIFIGPQTEPEPKYAFAYRDRMDERYDMERVVRDKRFIYIKNYMPYVKWGQHLTYLWCMVAMQAWEQCFNEGKCNPIEGLFFKTKPWVDELYDCQKDPDCVTNLAADIEYQPVLARMQNALKDWQLKIHDSGLLPESEMLRRAEASKTTIYQMVRDPKLYNLPAYLLASDVALAQKSANLKMLTEYLSDADSCIRYWGACGLVMEDRLNSPAIKALKSCLRDPSHDVRAMAAWALIKSGDKMNGQECLIALLEHKSYATLKVLDVIDWMGVDTAPYLPAIKSLRLDDKNFGKDDIQTGVALMRDYLLDPHKQFSTEARGPIAHDEMILEKAGLGLMNNQGIPYDELIP